MRLVPDKDGDRDSYAAALRLSSSSQREGWDDEEEDNGNAMEKMWTRRRPDERRVRHRPRPATTTLTPPPEGWAKNLEERDESRRPSTSSSLPPALQFATDEEAEKFLDEEEAFEVQEQHIPTLRLAAEYYDHLATSASEELDIASASLVRQSTAEERRQEAIAQQASFFTAYYQQQGLLPTISASSSSVQPSPSSTVPFAVWFQREVMQEMLGAAWFRIHTRHPLTRLVVRHQLERRQPVNDHPSSTPPVQMAMGSQENAASGEEEQQQENDVWRGPSCPALHGGTPTAMDTTVPRPLTAIPKSDFPPTHATTRTDHHNGDKGVTASPSSEGAGEALLPPSPRVHPPTPAVFHASVDDPLVYRMRLLPDRHYAAAKEADRWETGFLRAMDETPSAVALLPAADPHRKASPSHASAFPCSPPVATLEHWYWLQRQVSMGSVVLTDTLSQFVASTTVRLLLLHLLEVFHASIVSVPDRRTSRGEASAWHSRACLPSPPILLDLFGDVERRTVQDHKARRREVAPETDADLEGHATDACPGGNDVLLDVAAYMQEEQLALHALWTAHQIQEKTTTSSFSPSLERETKGEAEKVEGTSASRLATPAPLLSPLEAKEVSTVLDGLGRTILLSLLSSPSLIPSLQQRHPSLLWLAPSPSKALSRRPPFPSCETTHSRARPFPSHVRHPAPKRTATTEAEARNDAGFSPKPSTPTSPPSLSPSSSSSFSFGSIPSTTFTAAATVVLCIPPTSEDGRRVRCFDSDSFPETATGSLPPSWFSPNNFIFRCQDAGTFFFPRLKQALRQALRCAVDGGYVLYSTYSLNPLENEAVICAVLSAHRRAAATATPPSGASACPSTHAIDVTEQRRDTPQMENTVKEEQEHEEEEGLLEGIDRVECVTLSTVSERLSNSLVGTQGAASSCTRLYTTPLGADGAVAMGDDAGLPKGAAAATSSSSSFSSSGASRAKPSPYRSGVSVWYGVEGGETDQDPSACLPEVVAEVARTAVRVDPWHLRSAAAGSQVDDFWFAITLRVHRVAKDKHSSCAVPEAVPALDFPLVACGASPAPHAPPPPPEEAQARLSMEPSSVGAMTIQPWSAPVGVSAASPFLCVGHIPTERHETGIVHSRTRSSTACFPSLLYGCTPAAMAYWKAMTHVHRKDYGGAKNNAPTTTTTAKRVVKASSRHRHPAWTVVTGGLPVGVWGGNPLDAPDTSLTRRPLPKDDRIEKDNVTGTPLPTRRVCSNVFWFSSVLSGTSWLLPLPHPSASLAFPMQQWWEEEEEDMSPPPRCPSSLSPLLFPASHTTFPFPLLRLEWPLWCLVALVGDGELTSSTLRACLSFLRTPPPRPSPPLSSKSSLPTFSETWKVAAMRSILHVLRVVREGVAPSRPPPQESENKNEEGPTVWKTVKECETEGAVPPRCAVAWKTHSTTPRRKCPALQEEAAANDKRKGRMEEYGKRIPHRVCLLQPIPYRLCSTVRGKGTTHQRGEVGPAVRKTTEETWTKDVHPTPSVHPVSENGVLPVVEEKAERDEEGEVVPEVLEELQAVLVLANYAVHPPSTMPSSTTVDRKVSVSRWRKGSGGALPKSVPSPTRPPADDDDDGRELEWGFTLNAEEEEKWRRRLEDPFFSFGKKNGQRGAASLDTPHRRRRHSRPSVMSSRNHHMQYQKEEFSAMMLQQQEHQRHMRVRLRDTLLYTARHIGGIEAELAETFPLLLSTVRTSTSSSSSFISHST